MTPLRPKLSLEELRDGVLAGNRGILARAITLMESSKPVDQKWPPVYSLSLCLIRANP